MYLCVHPAAGVLVWAGQEYPSISSFALHVLKTRNPERRACDGWREVRLNGKRLEVFKHAWIHARMMAEHAATTQG